MKTIKFYLEYWGTRLFYIIFIFLICYGSYCYSVPTFSIGSHAFKNLLYHVHNSQTIWLYYLEYFIFIFLILTILTFMLTLYYGIDKRRKEKMHNRYISFYMSSLLSYLFMKNKLPEKEIKQRKATFKKFVKNDYSKELIINTLLQIHSQTVGEIHNDTELILHELKYDNLIRSYLYSPYYRHKKIALNVISEFKINGVEKYILELTKRERNNLLHTDALVALIRLNTYENLLLLIKNDVSISMWEVNVIIDNIEKDKIRMIPYKELLHSNNKGMQLLGVILSRLHKKQEFKYDIQKYIEYPNDHIMEEAIITFASFAGDKSDFVCLRNSYNKATGRGKLSIIKTFPNSPDTEYAVEFLEWIAINEPIKYKTEALRSLLTINIGRVARLKDSENPLVRMACNEILDINI